MGIAATAALLVAPGASTAVEAQMPERPGYFTEDQAHRGFTAFNKYCAMCHTVDDKTTAAQIKSGRGIRIGRDGRALMNVGGRYLMRTTDGHPDYPSVYYLFNRIREGMPAFGSDMIGLDTKTDIVAYLLQENGLRPGPNELTPDVAAMKRMPINPPKALDETGFEPIFNGKDFSGWNFMMGPNCTPAPEGCGKTTPSGVFRVENGEIVCTGKIQGYMYSEKKYLNFTWRFDYRFEPPADWDESEGVSFYGNSGYFLFVNEHRVWPKGIQIEGYHRDPLAPFSMDAKLKFSREPGALQKAKRPLGAWNSVEIQSKDGIVKSWLNGILLNTITEHEFTQAGHIAFESEGAEIHWRNVRLRAD